MTKKNIYLGLIILSYILSGISFSI
ncbi:hypothetical protein LCGC14_1118920, partial [marine sediment metagenome]